MGYFDLKEMGYFDLKEKEKYCKMQHVLQNATHSQEFPQ